MSVNEPSEAPQGAPTIALRRARLADYRAILDLVNGMARDQVMLPRSPASVIESIRDFVVAEVDGAFAGCAALHVVWSDIGEVRSIAVSPTHQKLGLGRLLVERLIEDADELGLARVMAFTYVTGFFEKLGFHVVEHQSLPHKVFNDCLNCPKYHACDEVAVLRVLRDMPEQAHERGPLSAHGGGQYPLPVR